MADLATLNRAARIVALITPRDPAEAVLRRELTSRRDLLPARRRDIVRAVAACFRWRGWLDASAPPQRRVAIALELQARFDADPAAIKPETLAARAVPAWIWDEIAFPDDTAQPPLERGGASRRGVSWLRQLQRDPPLWIRVRREFADVLPRRLGDCVPASLPSTLDLRLSTGFRYAGPRDLFLTEEFREGRFEIQDLASQLVGLACAPQPGETWWDAFSGEGGKTLHLADLMQNKGLIWASDRSVRRLQTLKKRAARAQVFNYRTVFWNGGAQLPTRTRFDGILVDAPCSGVGTWQRHPHARWTVSPTDVHELAIRQRQFLDHVAGSLKPGGRLVYSVCTLTRAETSAVAAGFSAAHPEYEPAAVFVKNPAPQTAAENRLSSPPAVPLTSDLRPLSPDLRPLSSLLLWPQTLDANGMFIAVWRRKL
jgi:16S rRNA (cytosine967-C5)-methyltransferase